MGSLTRGPQAPKDRRKVEVTLGARKRGLGATARSPQGELERMEGTTEDSGLEGLIVIVCS